MHFRLAGMTHGLTNRDTGSRSRRHVVMVEHERGARVGVHVADPVVVVAVLVLDPSSSHLRVVGGEGGVHGVRHVRIHRPAPKHRALNRVSVRLCHVAD